MHIVERQVILAPHEAAQLLVWLPSSTEVSSAPLPAMLSTILRRAWLVTVIRSGDRVQVRPILDRFATTDFVVMPQDIVQFLRRTVPMPAPRRTKKSWREVLEKNLRCYENRTFRQSLVQLMKELGSK